jgi:protein SCO1/2
MYLTKWINSFCIVFVLQAVLATNATADEFSTQLSHNPGGEFTLISSQGSVSLSQYRGKVVLLFFGYTSCPDVCPTTLSTLSRVFARLNEDELDKTKALFISLDPDRDTPELLQKYTGYFHPSIIGVTANVEVLKQVTELYGVAYERKEKASSPLGYVINHTFDVLVVNREGKLLDTRIRPTTSSDDILAYLKTLLGSSS